MNHIEIDYFLNGWTEINKGVASLKTMAFCVLYIASLGQSDQHAKMFCKVEYHFRFLKHCKRLGHSIPHGDEHEDLVISHYC